MLRDYIRQLEEHRIGQIVISSPTFTQYGKRFVLMDEIQRYADRSDVHVSTLIGSVRADELSSRYLDAVSALGEFGHLFTELSLNNARGMITLAPEFASEDLVRIYNKTMTRARVNRAVDMLRENGKFPNVMLYFMIGAPGETPQDRLMIADYAAEIFERLGAPDGAVIVKLMHFVPTVNTVSQRLAMATPDDVGRFVEEIRSRLLALVGPDSYSANFRVLWGEKGRLLFESVCARGDRRVGRVIERLVDEGADTDNLTTEQLSKALATEGLDHRWYLLAMDRTSPVPWEIVNEVDPRREQEFADLIAAREKTGPVMGWDNGHSPTEDASDERTVLPMLAQPQR